VTDPVADAKERAVELVRTAQALVARAEHEAESIVREGQQRVEGIITDANALRSTAERDAETVRHEAERLLADARERADHLLAEARDARHQALESAKSDLRAAPEPEDPDVAVRNASATADRILRVARSEAEARRREITEDATRKAEQIERDARSRADTANKEHREQLRVMQQRELGAKARVRELEAEIGRLERLLSRVTEEVVNKGLNPDPAADPIAPREVTSSGIVFPAKETSPPMVDQRKHQRPVTVPASVASVPAPSTPSSEADPDLAKGLKAIRRRA
jgi:vacuolar-type H+-ATPase subunit H